MNDIEAIAIGGFDGMHKGHQQLFAQLGDKGAIVAIENGYANLTPKKQRELYTDYPILYLDLSDIKMLSGAEFIELLYTKFPLLKKIVVGYDFYFGKDRKYSFNDLKTLFKGDVVVVDEVAYNGDSIHSQKIRQKIKDGDIKGANAFLGYNYTLKGKHIKGQGLGAKELVATINLEAEAYLMPKEGVYVSLTQLENEEHFHPSVSFFGHRVSTDNSFAIETHILDGEVVCSDNATISLVSYIRENKKFDTLEKLKKAIQKDIAQAHKELKMLQL